MKKLMTLLFIGFVTLSVNAQEVKSTEVAVDPNAPVFEFETDVIDYGKIPYRFESSVTLIIKDKDISNLEVKSSCGCTTATAKYTIKGII